MESSIQKSIKNEYLDLYNSAITNIDAINLTITFMEKLKEYRKREYVDIKNYISC